MIADKHPVEPGLLVGAGEPCQVVRIHRGPACIAAGLRHILCPDHADYLDRHGYT